MSGNSYYNNLIEQTTNNNSNSNLNTNINFNNQNLTNQIQDNDLNLVNNSNIGTDEDKYYEDNYSMNVTYEEFETCKH